MKGKKRRSGREELRREKRGMERREDQMGEEEKRSLTDPSFTLFY